MGDGNSLQFPRVCITFYNDQSSSPGGVGNVGFVFDVDDAFEN